MVNDQSVLVTPEHPLQDGSPLMVYNCSPYGCKGTAAQSLMRTSPSLTQERRSYPMAESRTVYIVSDLSAFVREAMQFNVNIVGLNSSKVM